MKRAPAGLLAPLVCLLLAAACSGDGALEAEVSIKPLPSPTATPTVEPQPTPAVAYATSVPVAPAEPEGEIVSLGHLSGDVQVPGLPASFAPPVEDPALAVLVRTTLSGYEGSYSVVVRNLANGRSAYLNEGEVYNAASLFKLALLLEAYRQRDAGEIDFSRLLILDAEYAEYDLGTLEFLGLGVGDSLSLADALKAMIIVSDTPTAVMVQDVVDPVRVDGTLRSLGINDMSVLSDELPTTARDMARLLEAVAAGAGVTAESRGAMLALLIQEWIRDGIPAGLPPGTPAAHKTGNVVGATHDVALVWGPGGPYILAVLSDRSWESQPLAAVSRAVWDYFSAGS